MGINQDRICFFLPLWEGFQDKVIFVVDSSIINHLGVRSGEGASSRNVILRVSPQIPAHLRHWYFKKKKKKPITPISECLHVIRMSKEIQPKQTPRKIVSFKEPTKKIYEQKIFAPQKHRGPGSREKNPDFLDPGLRWSTTRIQYTHTHGVCLEPGRFGGAPSPSL